MRSRSRRQKLVTSASVWLEDGVFLAGEGEIADDVQAMAAAHRPAGHDGDDDFGHNRIRRCTSRMFKAGHAVFVDVALVTRARWSPPLQK